MSRGILRDLWELLKKVATTFDRVTDLFSLVGVLLVAAIILFVSTNIVLRYFFSRPIVGTVEITGYCILYMTFLGTTWLLRSEGHIKMDFVLNRLPLGAQAIINVITSILSALVCLIFTWYGARITLEVYQAGFFMPTQLKTPVVLTIFIIPLGSFLLFIQFLRRGFSYLRSWRISPTKDQRLQRKA